MTEQKILRTHTIQTVFDTFPAHAQDLATIMTRSGLHCVGCHASVFETLEQGILGHGFPEEKLQSMLQELNAVISGEAPKNATIQITALAAEKIRGLLAKDNKENWGLRFGIKDGTDWEYELAFREFENPGDIVTDSNGIKVYVSKFDMTHLNNTTIDFVENEDGAGFRIDNPNETDTASGCG